jgi:aryl-alcohol dehydrogenase-like predicted oxidoreductase
MQYEQLGRSGLKVSRLCLGTMNFGWVTDAAECLAIMDSALSLGINFWDTADVYNDGESEEIIARWFSQGEGRREKIVLGTKVYISKTDWPNFGRLFCAEHSQIVRAQLTSAQNRLHRYLSIPSHRSEHTMGRNLAGYRAAGARGKDHLRRKQ